LKSVKNNIYKNNYGQNNEKNQMNFEYKIKETMYDEECNHSTLKL